MKILSLQEIWNYRWKGNSSNYDNGIKQNSVEITSLVKMALNMQQQITNFAAWAITYANDREAAWRELHVALQPSTVGKWRKRLLETGRMQKIKRENGLPIQWGLFFPPTYFANDPKFPSPQLHSEEAHRPADMKLTCSLADWFLWASVERLHNSLSCFCIHANARHSRRFDFLDPFHFQQSLSPLPHCRRLQCYVKLASCGLTIISIRYCPCSNCNLLLHVQRHFDWWRKFYTVLFYSIVVIWRIAFPTVISYFL